MANVIVDRYIGDNGMVLFPIQETENNTSDLVSDTGIYFKAFTHTSGGVIEVGSPMGLLLAITYATA